MRHASGLIALAMAGVLAGCSGPDLAPPTPPTETAETAVVIPSVVGMDGSSALLTLEDDGFVVQGTWEGAEGLRSSSFGLFDVLAQSPSAGTEAPDGSTVVLELQIPALPDYSVTEQSEQSLDVWIDESITQRQAEWIVWELAQEDRPDGAYFVQINCNAGNNDVADNRQANGKFAIGQRGAALSGLNAGAQEVELRADATCP